MKLVTGHKITNNEIIHDADTIRFITDDYRSMFEIRMGKDGRSIELRTPESCKIDGVLYSDMISITPVCSNTIRIETHRYDLVK